MQLTSVLMITVLAFCASVSAMPTPGGPKGGTPHACHEAKAQQYQKAGNTKMAQKEKQEADKALKSHHAQGNHKRWALAFPAGGGNVSAVCKQAAEVQKKNHPGKEGQDRAKKFTGEGNNNSGGQKKNKSNNKHH